jgi:hypothetical protein
MEEVDRLDAIKNTRLEFPLMFLPDYKKHSIENFLTNNGIKYMFNADKYYTNNKWIECAFLSLQIDQYIYRTDYIFNFKSYPVKKGRFDERSSNHLGVLINNTPNNQDFDIYLKISSAFPLVEKVLINEDNGSISIQFSNYCSLKTLDASKYVVSNIYSHTEIKKDSNFIKIKAETKYSDTQKTHYNNYFVLIGEERYELDEIPDVLYRIVEDRNSTITSYLISHELFNQYSIDESIPKRIDEVKKFFQDKIQIAEEKSTEEIAAEYIGAVLWPKYDHYMKHFEYRYESIDKAEALYGFSLALFFNPVKQIIPILKAHQFVTTNIKELSNDEFGRRAEIAFNAYLKKHIAGNSWLGMAPEIAWSGQYQCEIIWENIQKESFKAFDFSITVAETTFKVDVKATRGEDDNVFYLSIAELEEILQSPTNYFIARLAFIEANKNVKGIRVNDDFYMNFYVLNDETLLIIKDSIDEWKNYYKENAIRFTIDHCKTPNIFKENIENKYILGHDFKFEEADFENYETFVFKKYLKPLSDNGTGYGEIPSFINELLRINSLLQSPKFKLNRKLLEAMFTEKISQTLKERFRPLPVNFEDDLPF